MAEKDYLPTIWIPHIYVKQLKVSGQHFACHGFLYFVFGFFVRTFRTPMTPRYDGERKNNGKLSRIIIIHFWGDKKTIKLKVEYVAP